MLAFSEHGPGFDCRNYCVVHAEAGRNADIFFITVMDFTAGILVFCTLTTGRNAALF